MTTTTLPKVHKDRGMEGLVAKWYTTNTAKARDEFAKLAQRVSSELPPGSSVLEVAPGPGYFCIELAKLGAYQITGLDLSQTFVEIASRKAAEEGVQVEFRQGNASSMPFSDDSFDFLLCRAAFKNFGQPVRALQEMCRVLKRGGKGLIIDLSRDASPETLDRIVGGLHLNKLNRAVTKFIFRHSLIKWAYTKVEFREMLAQTTFRNVEINEHDGGFEITMLK